MKKKFNNLDKTLIGLASFLFAFIVTTMIVYIVKGWQYDILISCVLGAGGIEAIAGAFIQISKYKHKDKEDKPDDGVVG